MVKVNCDVMKYNSKIKRDIITFYFKDMNKYVENNCEALKIEKTYDSIPSHFSNESNKFQFSKYAIRVSIRNFGYDECKIIKSIPLYDVFCMKDL